MLFVKLKFFNILWNIYVIVFVYIRYFKYMYVFFLKKIKIDKVIILCMYCLNDFFKKLLKKNLWFIDF